MTDKGTQIDLIFERLVDLSGEQREQQLDQACGGDRVIRDAVEARLRAFDRVAQDTKFLEPTVQLGQRDRAGIKIRCPHCDNAVEILDDENSKGFHCCGCGSHFNILSNADREQTDLMPETLGRFQLVDKLGDGAFGAVWRAIDPELDRAVAIKIPRKSQLQRQDEEFFLREARVAAQLQHPNIVTVHEIGRDGDTLYIVSDLIEGNDLSKWISDHQPNARQTAEMCIGIAQGLHHAHEAGVIHRDLKPSNILVSEDGQPHITDFGLAKREVGEVTMTMDGQILGTPAYMSPEQAKGQSRLADRRCDIYSLGVVLYEMITGRLPFKGNTPMLIRKVIDMEVPPPRQFAASIPKDLETICLKCLEKDPARRFGTVEEFAEDLQQFLNFQPIKAKRDNVFQRTSRWCRRHQKAIGINSIIGITAIVLTVVGLRFWRIHQEGEFATVGFSDGQETRSASLLSSDGKVSKRLSVPSMEDFSIRGGTYRMIAESTSGWRRQSQIRFAGSRHHDFSVESSWPRVWNSIPASQVVGIVDRVGVLLHDRRAEKLSLILGQTGQRIWEQSSPDLEQSGDRDSLGGAGQSFRTIQQRKKCFPIGDVNHDGTPDLVFQWEGTESRGTLVAYSGVNGDTLWERPGLISEIAPLMVSGRDDQLDLILVQGANVTRGINARTGDDVWKLEHEESQSDSNSGQELLWDQLARLESSQVQLGRLGQKEITVVATRNRMYVLNAITGEQITSMATSIGDSLLGILTGPDGEPLVVQHADRLRQSRLVARSLSSLEIRWQIDEMNVATRFASSMLPNVRQLGYASWAIGPDMDEDGYYDLCRFNWYPIFAKEDGKSMAELARSVQLESDRGSNSTVHAQRIIKELRRLEARAIERARFPVAVHVFSGRTGRTLSSHDIGSLKGGVTTVRYLEGSGDFVVSNLRYRYLITPGTNTKWNWHMCLPGNAHIHYLDDDMIEDFAIRNSDTAEQKMLSFFRGTPGQNWSMIESSAVDLSVDFTGDEIGDLIGLDDSESTGELSSSQEYQLSMQTESARPSSIRLLSGADGSLVWESVPLRVGFWRPCRDLDGDGLSDLLVGTREDDTPDRYVDSLRAISSRNGHQIWSSRLFASRSKQGNSQFGRAERIASLSSPGVVQQLKVIDSMKSQERDALVIACRMVTLGEQDRVQQHHWMLASLSAKNGATNWKNISSPFSILALEPSDSLSLFQIPLDGAEVVIGVDESAGYLGVYDFSRGEELWTGKLSSYDSRFRFDRVQPRQNQPSVRRIQDGVRLAFNSKSLSSRSDSPPTTQAKSSNLTSLAELNREPNTNVARSHIVQTAVAADGSGTTVTCYRVPTGLDWTKQFELSSLDRFWQHSFSKATAVISAFQRDDQLQLLLANDAGLRKVTVQGDDQLHDLWSWKVNDTDGEVPSHWIAASFQQRNRLLYFVARSNDLVVLDLNGEEPVELGRTSFRLRNKFGIWVLNGSNGKILVLKSGNLFRGIDMATFSQIWDWTSPLDVLNAMPAVLGDRELLVTVSGDRSGSLGRRFTRNDLKSTALLADTGHVDLSPLELNAVHVDELIVKRNDSRLMWTDKEVHFVEGEEDHPQWSWKLPGSRIQFQTVLASQTDKPDLLLFQHASIQRKVYLVDSSNGRLLWTGRFEQLPSEETRFKMTESDGLIELVYKEVDGQGDDNSTSISSQRFHGVNPAGRLLGLISHKPAPTVVIRKQNEYFSQILRPVDSSNQQ